VTADTAQQTVLFFGFASLRMLALVIAAPPFAHPAFPLRLRVGLALAASLVIAHPPAAGVPALDGGIGSLVVAGLSEIGVGAALGFAVRLAFAAMALCGEFVSVQSGIGAATVLDPSSGAASGVISVLFELVALIVFLALDGHHAVFRAIALSFERFPVASGGLGPDSFAGLVGLGGAIFELAARLAAPVTAATLLSSVTLGVLGRLVPQLNLMMLQLPAHVALTFGLLALGANAFSASIARLLGGFLDRAVATLFGVG
jgi:flagellar biosynthetic protein FliR